MNTKNSITLALPTLRLKPVSERTTYKGEAPVMETDLQKPREESLARGGAESRPKVSSAVRLKRAGPLALAASSTRSTGAKLQNEMRNLWRH